MTHCSVCNLFCAWTTNSINCDAHFSSCFDIYKYTFIIQPFLNIDSFWKRKMVDVPILSYPLPILTITLSDLNFSKSSLCKDMLCHSKAPIASLRTLSCISEVVLNNKIRSWSFWIWTLPEHHKMQQYTYPSEWAFQLNNPAHPGELREVCHVQSY